MDRGNRYDPNLGAATMLGKGVPVASGSKLPCSASSSSSLPSELFVLLQFSLARLDLASHACFHLLNRSVLPCRRVLVDALLEALIGGGVVVPVEVWKSLDRFA